MLDYHAHIACLRSVSAEAIARLATNPNSNGAVVTASAALPTDRASRLFVWTAKGRDGDFCHDDRLGGLATLTRDTPIDALYQTKGISCQ